MVTINDCRGCQGQFPSQDLGDGLCVTCFDKKGGKAKVNTWAAAHPEQVKAVKRAYIERKAAKAGLPVPERRPWQYK